MNNNGNIDTSTIFEDFSDNQDLKEDVQKLEYAKEKNFIYYIKLIGTLIRNLNILLFIVLIIGFSYISIQESNNLYQKQFLDPFCSVLLGANVAYEESNCSSLASVYDLYKKKLDDRKALLVDKIYNVIPNLYAIENFNNSMEVNFIVATSQDKEKDPLDILLAFDKLKNNFLSIDKSQLVCFNIQITKSQFTAKCSAYSSHWDREIPGYDGTKLTSVSGTSISLASSFLNFLDKSDEFELVNKQKVFNSSSAIDRGEYTYKTDFNIDLEYNGANLSL